MDKILVYFTPFAAESQIWLVKDGKASCSHTSSVIEDVALNIIGLAYSQNTYNVFVSAPYSMVTEITRLVQEKEYNNYSINKINVEGI